MAKIEGQRKLSRRDELAENIIIVDGFPGCGKTMLSPIMASLDRVEIASYAFEIEFICRTYALGGMSFDAAVALVRMLVDGRLYTNMMGRDVNFRYSDISSVFNTPQKWKYFRRLFGPGDEQVPTLIQRERPILNFNTHDLCQVGEPLFDALSGRLVFINVLRHPVFMLIQQALNMERLSADPRDIQIKFEHDGNEVPHFTAGWEDLYLSSNAVERAIYFMHYAEIKRRQSLQENCQKLGDNFIEIPFEIFVKDPTKYVKKICNAVGTAPSHKTTKEMLRQRVPRTNVVDGIPLSIYKRCGWTPPQKSLTEKQEYHARRQYAVDQGASKAALETLDGLSQAYENDHQIFV